MIQPKTLEALNYFIDEDMQLHKDNIEDNISKELDSYYKGYINALEYVKHLVNQNWLDDADYYKKKLEEANLTIETQQKEIELWKKENTKDFFKYQQLLEAYTNKYSG